MPKVIGHTPPWLSRPSPGAKIFSDPAPQSPASPSKRSSYLSSPSSTHYQGRRRLVASRGTELFTVVGNKIRWADLATVRDEWEENAQSGSNRFGRSRIGGTETTEESIYRTLDVSIYYQIRQIAVSPSGVFLAISTEHTVHIAVLPPSSRLREHDRTPLKLKTYQLGPTIHVIPESPLSAVLWHPLAAAGISTDSIVTVTAEAAVRVWELDRANKWSFERPSLAIDLRKLADGVSCDQDFEPSGFGKARGFSVDEVDMEVSAACFGGRGRDDEDAWASMTLWVAMRNGDIYALCPLLPSKWKPTSTTIPSLSTTVVSRMASIAGEEADMDERRAVDQQYEWVQEIDNEEPLLMDSTESLGEFEVRLRPQNPSAIPRLQGPFAIQPEDDEQDIEISDILVFPARLDGDELLGEDEYEDFDLGAYSAVPFTTLCVATPQDEMWVAIDLDGVSGQWLPRRGRSAFSLPSSDAKELTLIDTFAFDDSNMDPASNWPMFAVDLVHDHTAFLTTSRQIYSISLNEWVTRLAAELTGTEPVDARLRTRLETSCQDQVCVVNKIIDLPETSEVLSAPTVINEVSLGYFLIAPTPSTAYAVFFDQVHLRSSFIEPSSPELTATSPSRLNSQVARTNGGEDHDDLETLPTRSPYVPAKIFYANHLQPLEQIRQRLPPNLKRAMLERPMRLSPAMLEIMTYAHRTIGAQSAELEKAAAELFRRCDRLREELGDQVRQMSELAQRLQTLRPTAEGDEEDQDGQPKEAKTPDARLQQAKERQANLMARYEALRRKVGRLGSTHRDLTPKEKAWMEEISSLAKNVGVDVDDKDAKSATDDVNSRLHKRFETVKHLSQELLEESKQLEKQQQGSQQQQQQQSLGAAPDRGDSAMTSSLSASAMSMAGSRSVLSTSSSSALTQPFGVSSRLQKERIAEVMKMVEREGAIIEGVMERLQRLKAEY
ncbi:Nucleoporin NUP82 [Exophiala dermatitidis]|uniref:Nuclear pore complex protein An-Nup82 n=1 Tax=Exophiala dermatitidis (strain ATCC 34100 / CBS 525.76 / NIH/UT8656) TaxID=858893 RepID=H6CB83_EXODN|nr:uncharacterized protein HMPREF1120_08970 [Exophiala dermatitidis NIH/UT8656]EHY61030.1 hypothetical protein HMPREF1120_08970 [Exophiala dermatitidis NIH/UT8656]